MKKTLTTTRFLSIFFTCLLGVSTSAQTTVTTQNDTWNYLDDGSNQGTTWIDSGFNDASWSTGSGVFGMGGISGATITTTIVKEITTYFRKEVTITGHSNGTLDLNLLCDDGVVIYINGKEAYRYNMPSGTVTYTTTASTAVGGSDEGDYTIYTIADTFLIDGVNTIAVELHNQSATSSDLGFDLGITAAEAVDSSNYVMFRGGEWNYLDDGTDQGTSWVDSGFNDASWASGDAVLGYGTIDGNSITTTVSWGSSSSNKYPTTYFRKEVNLTNPNFTELDVYLVADDGAAVYINGKLAFTAGMPSTWDYLTYANFTASGADEGDYDIYTIPDTFLVNGVNTFAVEMHQVNASSSDLGFDMEIIGKGGRIVSGNIFLDMNGDGLNTSVYDIFGSGAIEIKLYDDADSNGIYTAGECIDSVLTSPDGTFSFILDLDVRHLGVKLMTEDMDNRVDYTTDTVYSFTLSPTNSDSVQSSFGQLGPRSLCLLIADNQNATDEYYMANRITGKNQYISTIEGRDLIEALAIRIGMDSMWACDEGQLGSVDIQTGAFTPIGTGVGYGYFYDPGRGGMHITDVDGMAYDAANDLLYGVHRRSGAHDLLLVIDRGNGRFVEDFFGSDHDFAPITGTGIMNDVDDIAFNPYTGQLLGVNNQGNGDSTRYITIDPATGNASVLSLVGTGDYEGMGYYNTGELYGTTGVVDAAGYHDNTIYQIDRNTGSGTRLDTLYSGAKDVEACDCLTGPTENLISGTVFYDNDSSGTYNQAIDSAYSNIKVYLYRDANENGIIDSGDYIIDSTYTASVTGFYVFITDSLGYFLTTPVIQGTTFEFMNTTTDSLITEEAMFEFHGDFDGRNDFGFNVTAGQPYLPVEWLDLSAEWVGTDRAKVIWSTGSEKNSQRFEVQRRNDDGVFKTIQTLNAAGSSNSRLHYKIIDADAGKQKANHIYYRIKQYDYDGKYTYSSIVPLKIDHSITINAYPNPVQECLDIEFNAIGRYTITLLDLRGSEVLRLVGIKEEKLTPIRLNGLTPLRKGLYFMRLEYNDEDHIIRIIK
jgi:hypothetical protein